MRFAPYLARVSMAFSKVPQNYAVMSLRWSTPGLEALPPAALQWTDPRSNALLFAPLHSTLPVIRFFDLPEQQSTKGTLAATFSNGDTLENSFVAVLFCEFLAALEIEYRTLQDQETGAWQSAALLNWQIAPSLINRVGHYTLQSMAINDNQAWNIGHCNTYIIAPLTSGQMLSVRLSAIGFDGLAIGTVDVPLYAPELNMIPTRAHVSSIGYGKQIDSGGVQEIYQVNHDQTLAQLTLPVQSHSAETRSLGEPLALMDPATVTGAQARNYVNTFDPDQYNQPFDYTEAKDAGAAIAPQATASLNEQHQGNYALNHQGTLNRNINVNRLEQSLTAPQINNTVEHYQGCYSGETFNKVAQNEYQQTENELTVINEHQLQAPYYEENINQLTQQNDVLNLYADNMMLSGDSLSIHGPLSISGKCDLGWAPGASAPAFQRPMRVPATTNILYNQDMKISKIGLRTLAVMENVKFYYYNDRDPSGKTDPPAGNCTYGMGHLVRQGPCGSDLGKSVSEEDVYDAMRKDVAHAENIVKKHIRKVKLTQAKFDALVCYFFNSGITELLDYINQGANDKEVVDKLLQYQWARNRKTGQPEKEGGLLKRSEWEAVAFGYKGPFYKNLSPPSPTWGTD